MSVRRKTVIKTIIFAFIIFAIVLPIYKKLKSINLVNAIEYQPSMEDSLLNSSDYSISEIDLSDCSVKEISDQYNDFVETVTNIQEIDPPVTVYSIAGSDDMTGMIFEGEMNQACKNKAIELYRKVPQNVKDALVNSGYYIIVSTNPEYTQGHAGMYWYTYPIFNAYNNGYIGVYATSVSKTNMAVNHEIGHFIDNYVGVRDGYDATPTLKFLSVSSCVEWKEIYEAEVSASGYPSWTNYCQEEYFAETVWKALAEPEWCSKTLPRSYKFVVDIINDV